MNAINQRDFTTGLVVLTLGLALTATSAFLETVALLGAYTDFARGLCDGLAVVAFVVALILMLRSRRPV